MTYQKILKEGMKVIESMLNQTRRSEQMDTEQMIRELRYLEEKYKNCTYSTFETNWYCLCHDVANRLEELNEELKALKK